MVANTKAAVAQPIQILRLGVLRVGYIHDRRNFADHFRRQQLPDVFGVVQAVVHEFKCPGDHEAQSQTDAETHAAELEAVGKSGLRG